MEIVPLTLEDIHPDNLKDAWIAKSNNLIDALYQDFTVYEQRVVFTLITQIDRNDEDFKTYRISIAEFAQIMGIKSAQSGSLYKNIRNTCEKLLDRKIRIQHEKSWFMSHWLSSAKYVDGSGCVELRFDPNLKPFLLRLKGNFTKYKYEIALRFNSRFSIRLYEKLKMQFQIETEVKKRDILIQEYSLEELREIFSVGKDEYKLFADFKKWTITPAITEINDRSDLNIINFEYLKTGRKVTALRLTVVARSKDDASVRAIQMQVGEIETTVEVIPKEEDHPIFLTLEQYGINRETAIGLKRDYGVKRIERNISYMLGIEAGGEVIKNKGGYLNKAIVQDYGNVIEAQEQKKKEQEAKKQADLERKQQRQIEEKKKAEEQKQKNIKTIEAFALLPVGLRKVIKQGFIEVIKDNQFKLERWSKLQDLSDDSTLKDEALFRSEFVEYLVKNNFID